ncbi:carboxypeptidase-like regulatory domain-containing protein [Alteraurantiacibacter aquimixticola]|uniref:Carboxypeptidase regulatory-like domain-containing protein n=1 Tax=Alteraurantiacibacter aquimixticola TaxID=2489173 RepID=A0A4T3F4Q0_9SPHN|nr:carboxypeptidase-like regulatory domain-containing protein [Alteraurantiacibacter aquimixticola]TIX50478.1 carboxypeptidase regulatory-like domain-containing protein [Alteraurantiacibacter aquimixticola]
MRKAALVAAALSLGLSLSATAGEVTGTVYDARGVPAAGVELALGDARAMSDADGAYRFADIAAGDHMVEASGQRAMVAVPAEGIATRNIVLMSSRARAAVTGVAAPAMAEDAFAEAMQLAHQMVTTGSAQGEVAWTFNDREG